MNRHVAIDLGASGGRVALGTIESGKLDVDVLHRFPNGGIEQAGGLYWDIEALWREIRLGLRLAGERGQIASVGVNSWGVDYALLDADDQLIDGIRHYRDPRTENEMERLFQTVPRETIYERTGIQFMALNTIFQLRAEKPEVLERASRLLFVPDLFHFWLCGRKASERTIASTSQLYNPRTRDWDDGLIADCGFPRHLFGDIIEPGTVLGDVLPEIGLPGAKVIAPAAHDTASAVAAVPAEGEDWAYVSSGTWALAGLEIASPTITAETLALNLTNEAGVRGTTRLLKNIVGLWILQECRRGWGDPGYSDLYAEAEAAKSTGKIDPDNSRFLQPCGDMPQRVRAFCWETGQSVPESRGEIARCVLEGLASKTAEVLTQLELVSGRPIREVHIVGGGSQIRFLNQLVANVSGRTVVAGPAEATLMGNLLVQADAYGSIDAGSMREIVRRTETPRTYEPA